MNGKYLDDLMARNELRWKKEFRSFKINTTESVGPVHVALSQVQQMPPKDRGGLYCVDFLDLCR